MELDDLKHAWQTLDRRLERQNALQLHVFREGKLKTLRRRLWPLAGGQVLLIIFGAMVAIPSASFWAEHWREPAFLAMGLVMHAYGVAMIIIGSLTLSRLAKLDYAAPVLDIQRQLLEIRRHYVLGGMAVGLPWWVLWVLVVAMLAKAGPGLDLLATLPTFFWSSIAFGIAGLLGTGWFHHWLRNPSRTRLATSTENSLAGSSLRRAQAVLDELTQFEQE